VGGIYSLLEISGRNVLSLWRKKEGMKITGRNILSLRNKWEGYTLSLEIAGRNGNTGRNMLSLELVERKWRLQGGSLCRDSSKEWR
jgi:hypothetical protein